MKKADLKDGMVIETREGDKYLIKTGHNPLGLNCNCNLIKECINEDLTNEYKRSDIMKVYEDYTLKKVLWKRKEEIKLTEDEKAILRSIDKKYKWIVRDSREELHIFTHKPKMVYTEWVRGVSEGEIVGDYINFSMYKHLFQFIKWEDKEPTLIEDLL